MGIIFPAPGLIWATGKCVATDGCDDNGSRTGIFPLWLQVTDSKPEKLLWDIDCALGIKDTCWTAGMGCGTGNGQPKFGTITSLRVNCIHPLPGYCIPAGMSAVDDGCTGDGDIKRGRVTEGWMWSKGKRTEDCGTRFVAGTTTFGPGVLVEAAGCSIFLGCSMTDDRGMSTCITGWMLLAPATSAP